MLRLFITIGTVLLCLAQPTPRQQIRNLIPLGHPLHLEALIHHGPSLIHSTQFNFNYHEEEPPIQELVTLALPQTLEANLTIEVTLSAVLNGHLQQLSRTQKNLTRYQVIRKEGEDQVGGSYDPMDEIQSVTNKQNKENNTQDEQYCLHLPQQFDIMPVVSHMSFPQIIPQHRLKAVNIKGSRSYLPPVDISQVYIPTTHSRPLGQNNSITLRLRPMAYTSYLMFYSIGHIEELKDNFGIMGDYLDIKEEWLDQFKEFFFMNPIWLVVLYYVLSITEIGLKTAFIRSEFLFWKNIGKNKGVSLKTLFFQLSADVIIFLYLYEYKASKLILVFNFVDILVTVWKISRTYSLRIKSAFPFLTLTTSDLYKQRADIDSQSVWYMNYLLVPLMGCYLIYSLHFKRHWHITNYYRFILQTLVAFIALFGFILMTPQLYINYKLKSVDHLNWKGLIYRFINTIIDDLFAFMVTMPALRRAMYFRDDVIFLIYLFQRYIYRTDYSRKTVFTSEQHTSTTADAQNELKTIKKE